MQQVLKNAEGKPIGYIRDVGDMSRLFNANGKLQGFYNRKSGITCDPNGTVIARCNILVSLLRN